MINGLNQLYNSAGNSLYGSSVWNPAFVWSTITSDCFIAISYFLISGTLLYLVKKIKLPPAVFLTFGVFVVSSGLGHFINIINMWIPIHWGIVAIKITTALTSIAAVVGVFLITPRVFKIVKDLQDSVARKKIIDEQILELNKIQNLREKDNQVFEAILSSSTDQIFKMDKEGVIDYISPAVAWQLRRGQETILGKKWEDIGFSPAAVQQLDSARFKILNGELIVTGEVGLKSFQGLRTFQYIITPIYSKHRDISGVVANLRDVTDRKEYEERFQLLVKEVKDYAIFMLDPSGKVVSWNEGAANIKGYKESEVIGRHFSMFYVPDEIRDGLPQEDLKKAEKNGHSVGDGWRIKKDGTRFYASFVLTALRDANGSLRGFAKVTHDVTAKKKAEDSLRCAYQMLEQSIEDRTEELQLLNERYQELVNTLDGIVWEANIGRPGYTFVSRQAEHILGYSMEKWEQTPGFWQTILHEEDKDRIAGSGYKNANMKCDSQNEYRMITAAGKTIWMREYIKVFFDNKGIPSKMRGIMVDITERKQAEARLRLAEQNALRAAAVKAEFLANMSHEIRTPLNAIIGMATVSLDMQMSEELRDSLSTIKIAGDSLLTLVNDILDFSKIEAGKLQLEVNGFSILEVAQNVIELAQPLATPKKIQLILDVDSKIPNEMLGDSVRILQILLNLVSNAIKFSKENDAVKIKIINQKTTNKDKIKMRLEVIDVGIGISDEGQKRLFQPFTQGDTSTARKYGGTGLGLSICKRLTELMNGKLGVTSELGKGSVFWIELELLTTKNQIKAKKVITKTEIKKNHESKILVADDNFANQKVILRFLKKIGYEADVVYDGKAAVEAYQKNKYDLILMDCQMPEMDGYEAVRNIRNIEQKDARKRMPVIALTAHALSGDRKKCQEAGMDDYLTKPISITQLEKVLSNWLKEGSEEVFAEVVTVPSKEEPTIDYAYIKSLEVLQEDGHPDVVIELIEHFSTIGPKKVQHIKTSLLNRDYDTVKREAHNFKSTCMYIGAKKLGLICQELEHKVHENAGVSTAGDGVHFDLIIKRFEAEFSLALSSLEVLMKERKQKISA